MPTERPCRGAGCRVLTSAKDGFCAPHRREWRQRQDAARPSAAKRGYDARWDAARRAFLKEHPFCECADCQEAEKPRRSTTVDHIIPHRGDRMLFWDRTNWRAMSKPCHDRKTATRDGGFGRAIGGVGKELGDILSDRGASFARAAAGNCLPSPGRNLRVTRNG
jgi:5-methylcytosine-specific restriction protein A